MNNWIVDDIELVFPTMDYKEQVLGYKQEFLEHGDSMDGTVDLRNAESYEAWLKGVENNVCEETVKDGFVPAHAFLAVRKSDGHLVGMIDVRHRLNDFLMKFGGNIGYSVRKSERRKGYAKEMLRLALVKCRELSINKVLVTCDQANEGSSKTIKANNGILENEVPEEGRITQRYWIMLD